MKVPTTLLRHPRRAAAALGATIAVAAVGGMAVAAGTASAQEIAQCTDNVNVREAPEPDADIVALCPAGSQVRTGETSGEFVELTDLGGWASRDFIATAPGRSSNTGNSSDAETRTERVQRTAPSAPTQGQQPQEEQKSPIDAPVPLPAPVQDPTGLLGGLLG